VKSAKLFGATSDGGGSPKDAKAQTSNNGSASESEGSESSKSSNSATKNVVPRHGSREKDKLEPLYSVEQCVEKFLDVVEFLSSDNSAEDKYKRLVLVFEDHCGNLAQRIGTSAEDAECAQICMSLAILTLIHSILPDEVAASCFSRLTTVTKEFSIQGVSPGKPPESLDLRIRKKMELLLETQLGIVEEVLNRWFSDLDSQLTRAEVKSIQGLALEFSAI
jgi:hypothetical protein